MRRKALVLMIAATLVDLAACGSGGPGSGGEIRTVLMDYKHDEVITSLLAYFPKNVAVHAGDTVRFKQAWTGEAHSVTMGTAIDAYVPVLLAAIEKYPTEEEAPPELVAKVDELGKGLPGIFPEEEGGPVTANQNGAQPCYLDDGLPPEDVDTPCPRREQPPFTGRQSYYSSGFVPYEGPTRNVFDVPLSADIAPGTYSYYCNVHWVEMSGTVKVVPDSEEIPSQEDVSAQARKQIEAAVSPLLTAARVAKTKAAAPDPLAGVTVEDDAFVVPSIVNEFVPANTRVKAGARVTWTNAGYHSIAFNVPEYFPILTIDGSGEVILNDQVFEPVTWPGLPKGAGGDGQADGEGPAADPVKIDAGDFDGSGGLHSSGRLGPGVQYTVRFTKKGTFNYACLVHPQMVAKVVVT